MDITIQPGKLCGRVAAIPSKSQAHRLLICAAFADKETILICPETNRDIEATADCLNALGATVHRTSAGYSVIPATSVPESAELNCCESGSTLRFMLPVAGALGVDAVFQMEGRLPQRPLSPLWEEMDRMGCNLSRPSTNTIRCQGKLRAGLYTIDGSVSSQYISGLMLGLSLLDKPSTLTITGKVESKPYIDLTRYALRLFGSDPDELGMHRFHTPGQITVEGDWSNAAFFLAANVLGNQVRVSNLQPNSSQGDRAIAEILPQLDSNIEICVADIPDLVPILAVAAAANHGAVFTNARRLRLKESDRIASTIAMLNSLGGQALAAEDSLTVFPGKLQGGTVDSFNDHRIAMAAAIAATVCSQPVTILNAQCVEKSYPAFWMDYKQLGGQYEQHLR